MEAAVARDMNHALVRLAYLCADGCAVAEAHGAQTAGGQERARLGAAGKLCSPHLVLADVGCHNVILANQLINLLHQLMRTQHGIVGLFAHEYFYWFLNSFFTSLKKQTIICNSIA